MKYIYFARVAANPNGPIKIGCSSCPTGRCKQIGFDLATVIEVIASAPGDYFLERNLHLKFAAHKALAPTRTDRDAPIPGANEWFAPVPELLALIADCQATGRIDLSKSECRERIFADRYLAGETLQEIAEDFGVTRERVRQVLRSIGVPSRGTLPEHRRPKRYRERYRQWIASMNARADDPRGPRQSARASARSGARALALSRDP